jgi:hypothetical protein
MAAPTYPTGTSTLVNIGGTTGLSSKHLPRVTQKFEYDVSTFTGTTGQALNLIAIPAFTQLDSIQVIVVNALTLSGTPSISVGDTANSTLFVNGASTLTAGTVLTQATTTNPLKFYSALNYIVLTITGSSVFPGTGLLRFVVTMTDCTRDAPMVVPV